MPMIILLLECLQKARVKLREAENESDLYTDEELTKKKRKRVRNRLFVDSDSDEPGPASDSQLNELHTSLPSSPVQNLNQSKLFMSLILLHKFIIFFQKIVRKDC